MRLQSWLTLCLCIVCYSKFFRRSVTGDHRSSITSGSSSLESGQDAGMPGTTSTMSDGGPTGSKPRSLRFTWSMKTTSSMDPADMMKEIRKVSHVSTHLHLFVTSSTFLFYYLFFFSVTNGNKLLQSCFFFLNDVTWH